MADYSESDVQSLAQKFGEFKQTLTPGEQAALKAVIERVMPQAEDVAGFSDRRDRPSEGDIKLQAGDPLGSVFNIFNIFGTP